MASLSGASPCNRPLAGGVVQAMKLLVAVALAGSGLLTLAACSGGEGAALPDVEGALDVVPTEVPRADEGPVPVSPVTETALLPEESPPTALESADVVGQPATGEVSEAQMDLGPWPRPDVEHAEFPDIALLVQPRTWGLCPHAGRGDRGRC